MSAKAIDKVTREWIRNASDERAARNGCRFDPERGQFVIDWAAKYLRLYEGEWAGQPLIARDWQVEVTMRLFGWVKHSDRWGREVRRFNAASIWIPKKNKKSPTLAWWGLYLLCGDGEMGQKVFFGAKDGAQAREIAGKHAVEMVLASDELMADCEINKSLMQITHGPTRSILKPMSSGDSKTQKSKEGINGSVLIDETHVVDKAFMARISRAGISRSEPLQIEVSTAGNDPQSYGFERYTYGKTVEEGSQEDERLFFASYEAPHNTTDRDIDDDPCKFGRLANPAWGHTVGEEEFTDDYKRSRPSIVDFADFKMYRLNVWQQSENPWLNMADWYDCRRDYDAESLLGKRCYAGLDLAKVRDTSALVLVFPEDDGTYKQLAYFWQQKKTAEQLAKRVDYLKWANSGHIELTSGSSCDYRAVGLGILRLSKLFDIRKIAFDSTYAQQTLTRLVDEDGMDHNAMVPFKQTIMEFAEPTAAYERLLIDGKLHHNGHPVLTWQAGNVKVKFDNNGNKRPVKQKDGDVRTIDGIVAAIMGVAAALKYGGEDNVWSTERDGLLLLG